MSGARSRGARRASLPALLLGLGAWVLVAPAACRGPEPFQGEQLRPSSCGECHQDAWREWQASAHARSWSSLTFKAASGGYAAAECLGCHAPRSLFEVEDLPEVRGADREHGVDCQACHLDHGVLVGPLQSQRDPLLQAHPVRKQALLYRSMDLCGRCHRETSEEVAATGRAPWQSGRVATCQECHMPAVERQVTQSGGLAALRDREHPQRRHSFALNVLPDLGRAVEVGLALERTEEGSAARVTLLDLLPHEVPSGKSGGRPVRLQVRFLDGAGAQLEAREHRFSRGDQTQLRPGEPRELREPLPADAKRLELRLVREDRQGRPALVLHHSEHPLP